MDSDRLLDLQAVLDGLGQGVLIFDSAGRLVLDNLAARTLLGTDLKLIRSEGWTAAAVLFNSGHHDPTVNIDSARRQALDSARPVRFHTYRAGEYVPCWAAIVPGRSGDLYTMITVDAPDWSIINDLIGRFRSEVQDAAEATQGHLRLINQSIGRMQPAEPVGHLIKRIGGFNRLIATHMYRTASLMDLLGRLQALRTGTLRAAVRAGRQRIALSDFIEDFIESLDEITLLDPESEPHDFRGRLKVNVPPGLAVSASPSHLATVLRDVLRNAIMYSMKATPVCINAAAVGQSVQIDVIDEGYGIRAREQDRVFQPFQRARQPQIISEFGYGLSLYLCKHEIEAMNGGMWFRSEEGVGSTFSIKLPAWRDVADDTPSAQS
ncbi:MAG: sensor histidine kinase [Aggregatilineales bacterium]